MVFLLNPRGKIIRYQKKTIQINKNGENTVIEKSYIGYLFFLNFLWKCIVTIIGYENSVWVINEINSLSKFCLHLGDSNYMSKSIFHEKDELFLTSFWEISSRATIKCSDIIIEVCMIFNLPKKYVVLHKFFAYFNDSNFDFNEWYLVMDMSYCLLYLRNAAREFFANLQLWDSLFSIIVLQFLKNVDINANLTLKIISIWSCSCFSLLVEYFLLVSFKLTIISLSSISAPIIIYFLNLWMFIRISAIFFQPK